MQNIRTARLEWLGSCWLPLKMLQVTSLAGAGIWSRLRPVSQSLARGCGRNALVLVKKHQEGSGAVGETWAYLLQVLS